MSEHDARDVIRDMERVLADPFANEDDLVVARTAVNEARAGGDPFEIVLKVDHDAIRVARLGARLKVKDAMDELQAAVKRAITYEAREGKADA